MNGMPWFMDVANFLVTSKISCELSSNQRKKLKWDSLDFYWDESYLFEICKDGVIRRCVPEEEQLSILEACHSSPYGGHHGGTKTASKVLSYGFYASTLYKDASELVKSSCGNTYILVAVDYVSKWVEAVALPNNEAWSVVAFLKKSIFTRFGTPHAIISDRGSHFCNKAFDTLLAKTDWSKKLDDALWAYRTAYKTLIANLHVDQLNELDEFQFHTYSSSSLYKDKMNYIHDKYTRSKEFKVGNLVLLFNSQLRLFLGQLKSKWNGPFEVVFVTPFGAFDLKWAIFQSEWAQGQALLGKN
ncbi:uncharacterized protein [Nicotiana sylvestris]|uniref:uncharacterized protein n=1 Tax=Nicotiana sylvestris TaxID=4096 RepID=UPI00388CD10A